MNPEQQMPDVKAVLGGLKDFQRKTVEYVFRRLYLDDDKVDRFLIADEVGLGKTLVARGVIAKAIERLWKDVNRIDVVYICANRDIARQNVNRLNVTRQKDISVATRMTLLPLHLHNLKGNKLNFVSFTPGTSFDLRSSGGVAYERALIYHMLQRAWGFGNSAGPKNVLQCGAGREGWHERLDYFPADEIDSALEQNYKKALEQHGIRQQFESVVEHFSHHRKYNRIEDDDQEDRFELVGKLRTILAQSCVSALEPDIVILDEFQRFRDLLDGDDEVARLAKAVFNFPGAKVLMLSATPYKMYTMYREQETDDHYKDFMRTVRFLFNSESDEESFKKDLAHYRQFLLKTERGGNEDILSIKASIEKSLRKVMTRTERLSVSSDRSGMISEAKQASAEMLPEDLHAFAALDKIGTHLGVRDTVEYWKSAPYLLNVMDRDGYEIKRKFVSAVETAGDTALRDAIAGAERSLLPWKDIKAYGKIDPQNSKLRTLFANKIEPGAWKLLWVPPSLPYYGVKSGPYSEPALKDFTKALVFSSWMVVPKVISMLASYEAERKMVLAFDQQADYSAERRTRRPLLRFAFTDGRATGMAVFSLIYPCLTLAERIDPLKISLDLTGNGQSPTEENMAEAIMAQLHELLDPILKGHSTGRPNDERWYWASMAFLDEKFHPEALAGWLAIEEEAISWKSMVRSAEEEDSNFAEHVDIFAHCLKKKDDLGQPPGDLFAVLAKVALASPAVASLRSFLRAYGATKLGEDTPWFLGGAAKVAMGFRTLFNLSDTMTLLRSMKNMDDSRYWENVLDYCSLGNLQAVMDEYVHILRESLGLLDQTADVAVPEIAKEIFEAVTIKTSSLEFDEISVGQESGVVDMSKHSIRCRYALRFGDTKNEEEKSETRSDQVRIAFNSPFRPFILATTSIGQEGLDFHQYCHEIYHWNLPSNPVDLEQREGRIHRYKGHVIRKNVAKAFPPASLIGKVGVLSDPWETAFDLAQKTRSEEANDLIPYWIFELDGGYRVYRHIPALPLSKEKEQAEALKKTLVAYRMVLGQPRQEDLVSFLQQRISAGLVSEDILKYRIDLSPG